MKNSIRMTIGITIGIIMIGTAISLIRVIDTSEPGMREVILFPVVILIKLGLGSIIAGSINLEKSGNCDWRGEGGW